MATIRILKRPYLQSNKEAIEMVNYNITNGIVIKKLNSLIKG